MADFRVTLDRDLPIVEGTWDAGAAKRRIFERYTNAEGEFDAASAADAFLIGDPTTGAKGDLHMPVADIRDGDLKIIGNALRAARSRLGQGFPDGVPADVRDRANELAGKMLDELRERSDGHDNPWRLGVMLRIPPEIAAQFPENKTPAHVTLVSLPFAYQDQAEKIAEVVADVVEAFLGERVTLGPIDSFDLLERRVIFASVDVSDRVHRARNNLAERIVRLGATDCPCPTYEVDRFGEPWVPHATLAVVEPCGEYAGVAPTGSWTIEALEIWHMDRTVSFPDERCDRLGRRGSKWLALSEDGTKVLGEFDSEAEARERLRQVEAAKAARGDAILIDPRDVRITLHAVDGTEIALGTPAEQQRLDFGSAPAVHTESRVHVDEALRVDRAELGRTVDQANGWRRFEVLYSRADNVQTYTVGGRTVREYRPPSEVFDRVSMDSGVGVPWELRHSPDLLTPDSVRGVARGAVLSVEPHQDGVHTAGIASAWDRALWDAIDGGTARDVSVAYRCKVDRRPGTTDDGQRFDQRQMAIVWNSLASEPRGRAGTARVMIPRGDAIDGPVVSRADAMLEIARVGSSKPVYFDLSSWVPYDSTHRTPPKRQDAPPMMKELLMALIAARGMTPATVAEKMGLSEDDMATLLAGDTEWSPEQIAAFADMLAGAMRDGEHLAVGLEKPLDEDRMAQDAATVKILQDKLREVERRADKAEALAEQRAKEIEKMVPRADAEQMAVAQAVAAGEAIELARRALGNEFAPKPRKDGDTELPISIGDWQRAAIRGAFGDERGQSILDRIDAADPSVQPALLTERIADAKEILDERAHHSDSIRQRIAETRSSVAARREDTQEDGLARAKAEQRRRAAGLSPVANQPGA